MLVVKAPPKPERKVISGSAQRLANPHRIPASITDNEVLNAAVASRLPPNYNFEIAKTIWRIRTLNAKRVALQLPEGLALFACAIADILTEFAYDDVTDDALDDVIIMGDVTYGACCVDDLAGKALGIDLLVHYGHSCLVPSQVTGSSCAVLYVFVDVAFDTNHLCRTLTANFGPEVRLTLAATVQFVASLAKVVERLAAHFEAGGGSISLPPRTSPLSRGEVLGCTAPRIVQAPGSLVVFVADGRFHLEALMIANPDLADSFYLYNPYDKKLSHETYDYDALMANRSSAVGSTSLKLDSTRLPHHSADRPLKVGLVLSTLGRQGSPKILDDLMGRLRDAAADADGRKKLQFVTVLISEILPDRLKLFQACALDFWVQVGCPRLSIDWGHFYDCPLLTPYELVAALRQTEWRTRNYPMDYYAYDSLGPWTPNHPTFRPTPSRPNNKG